MIDKKSFWIFSHKAENYFSNFFLPKCQLFVFFLYILIFLPTSGERCAFFNGSPTSFEGHMISNRQSVVTSTLLLWYIKSAECNPVGIPHLFLRVTLLAFYIKFHPHFDFFHGSHWSLDKELVEVFDPWIIVECSYEHLLVWMYDFDGRFAKMAQQFRGPLTFKKLVVDTL